MLKIYFYLLIVLLTFSCGGKTITQNKETNLYKPINQLDSIRFNFSANRINPLKEYINLKIKATIFNDKSDTIYFLTTTCDGEKYSVHYDTSKFELVSLINCNASNPVVRKITPKGHYDFYVDFRDTTKEDSIKLGFDLYLVSKYFKVTNDNWNDLNVHNRPFTDQTIIWSTQIVKK